jgi:hypothetical protein
MSASDPTPPKAGRDQAPAAGEAPQSASESAAESVDASAHEPADESALDASRRKFREALERKKFGHHGKDGPRDPRGQAPHTSPAKPQRTFRRKSG